MIYLIIQGIITPAINYYYDTASHPVKFGLIENNYMKQWHGSSVSSLDDWSPLMKVVLLDGIIFCLQLDRIQNQSNRVLNFICSQIAWEKGVRPHLLWFLSQKFIEVPLSVSTITYRSYLIKSGTYFSVKQSWRIPLSLLQREVTKPQRITLP